MRIRIDLLVAHESEAEAIATTVNPLATGQWKGFHAHWFDQEVMSQLLAVLTDAHDLNQLISRCPTLSEAGEVGPLVCKVPDRLTGLLAELTERRIEEVAQAWVAQETFPGRRWIEQHHRRLKKPRLAKWLGRGGTATAENQSPDFRPLIAAARQLITSLRWLASEAKRTDKHLLTWVCH
jgi:hypothetical protein